MSIVQDRYPVAGDYNQKFRSYIAFGTLIIRLQRKLEYDLLNGKIVLIETVSLFLFLISSLSKILTKVSIDFQRERESQRDNESIELFVLDTSHLGCRQESRLQESIFLPRRFCFSPSNLFLSHEKTTEERKGVSVIGKLSGAHRGTLMEFECRQSD